MPALAKKGTLAEWIYEYNSCFNNAIETYRKTLDVKTTAARCQEQTRNRYQLDEKDAEFVASVQSISATQNKIQIQISTGSETKKLKIFYNGVCTNFEDPIKKVQLSAKDISDKLVADLNLNPENSQCLQEGWEKPKMGFAPMNGGCVRICLDNEIMTNTLLGSDGEYKSTFRCERCSDYMREYQNRENPSKKKMDYSIVYAHTSPDTNSCEDFNRCTVDQEYKNGKCLEKCWDDWIRNSKTLKCEKGPQVCQNQYVEAMQASRERYSQWQGNLQGSSLNSSCRQSVLRMLGEGQNRSLQSLQHRLNECHLEKTTNTYFESYFSLESEMDDSQRMQILNLCGMSMDELSLIMDPPANFHRDLNDYAE